MSFALRPRRADALLLPLLLPLIAHAQQQLASRPVQIASAAEPVTAIPAQGLDQQAMLKTTLDKLRIASARFVSAEANVQRVQHNSLVNSDDAPQIGQIYILRGKDQTIQFGLRVTSPAPRLVEYKNGVLKDDQPANKKCIAIKKQGIDSYVTLGFGGGPDELQREWTVTDLGPDTVSGTKVEKLSLIPIDVHVRSNFTKVEIWIDLDRDVTYKQVFYASNNDRQTATYSDIQYNKPIKPKPYAIKDEPCQ